jgi:Ca2+-binding RTX toxin-like protein
MHRNSNTRRGRTSSAGRFFESLEARDLKSATFHESTGELIVLAGSGNDAVYVTTSTNGIFTYTQVYEDGMRTFNSLRPITAAVVFGFDGNDNITIGPGIPRARVHGGEGNDAIWGGSGPDLLQGGGGDDVIHGGNGNDELHGNAGRDYLYGDGHNDTLLARDGQLDYISGGTGRDRAQRDDGVDDDTGYVIYNNSNPFGGVVAVALPDIEEWLA